MDILKTIPESGHVIEVAYDPDPMNPREFDQLGIMVLAHRRYSMPNEIDLPVKDLGSWETVREAIEGRGDVIAILPVYMYDHSGVALNTQPFSCPWDSGQVGFIFATKESVKKIGTPLDRVEKCLTAEVEQYSRYLNGESYMFAVKKVCPTCQQAHEVIDSCGGFESMEDAIEEARRMIPPLDKSKPAS